MARTGRGHIMDAQTFRALLPGATFVDNDGALDAFSDGELLATLYEDGTYVLW